MKDDRQTKNAASEGTSESHCSAGWEWRARDYGLWPMVNLARRLIGKPEIGDTVYAIHFDQPLVLQPGESATIRIPLPNPQVSVPTPAKGNKNR
jgi:hypothetical protein